MRRKPITLKDVGRDPQLLARFIKEHPSEADAERFDKLLGTMCAPIKKPRSDD